MSYLKIILGIFLNKLDQAYINIFLQFASHLIGVAKLDDIYWPYAQFVEMYVDAADHHALFDLA